MFIHPRIILLGFLAITLFSCGNNGRSSSTDTSLLETPSYLQDGINSLSKKEKKLYENLTSSSDSAIVRTKRLLAENNTLTQSLINEICQNLSLIPISEYSEETSMALSTVLANKRQLANNELLSLTQIYLDLHCRTFGQSANVKTLVSFEDKLITPESGDVLYAFYLCKGDSLFVSLKGSTNVDYYLYNYDEQRLVKNYKNVDRIGDYLQTGDIIPIEHNVFP